jgi:plastocyanin
VKLLLAAVAAALLVLLGAASPAAAEVRTETFRVGPIEVGGYEVKQQQLDFDIPKPAVDGHVTRMEVDVVDADGSRVPISRLMLHHIVFLNAGSTIGAKQDATCPQGITGLDSRTVFPNVAERFYAAGEERAVMRMPPGHGYPLDDQDKWAMTWMIMNHRLETDRAYIQYRVTYDTAPAVTPVTPYWLDVANCKADPVFDAPGGRGEGSRFRTSTSFTMPRGGRLVAGGGHVHGGAYGLRVSQPSCGDRTLFESTPAWGRRTHPFYNVKPVLHEPGPIAMSDVTSAQGFPLAAGQPVKLTATYDNERIHTRAMGISIAYVAHDAPPVDPCAALPGDVEEWQTSAPHRTEPPEFRVPLIGLDGRGRAVEIERPPGATRSLGRAGTIRVKDFGFSARNVRVRRGARLGWRFEDRELHDVTVADGPRGFSSPHLSDRRTFRQRLTAAGRYKLFCSLHPVTMTQTVEVR